MRILAACKKCSTQFDVTGHKPAESFHCICGARVQVPEPKVHDAKLVRCGSCGGSRGDGLNCEFCNARFSTIDKGWGSMCPGCFCRLPNDAAFCVDCGIKINPQKLDAVRSDMPCPRCTAPLQKRTLEGLGIFECAGCAGLWLPADTFECICKNKEAMTAVARGAGMTGAKRMRFEMSSEEKVKYIPCPACKSLMNRRNFGGISGVIMDTCRHCGVWLDDKELGLIVRFIDAGGMDKSRDAEKRHREHTEKMRTKVPPSLSGAPMTFWEPKCDALDLAVTVLPGLIRAVGMLAKAFRKL